MDTEVRRAEAGIGTIIQTDVMRTGETIAGEIGRLVQAEAAEAGGVRTRPLGLGGPA